MMREEREWRRARRAEGTQKRSDWPGSARQLGQRIPKITKLGTLHQLPKDI
jgi:hypothetical protein